LVSQVTGPRDLDQAAMSDGLVARILFGNGQKALQPPEKEHRASNVAEEFDGVGHMVTVWGNGSSIIVEFPEQRAVGFPVRPVQGQVTRDLIGEPRVDFLHARDSGVEARVAFGKALFHIPYGFTPVAHPAESPPADAVAWRETKALNV